MEGIERMHDVAVRRDFSKSRPRTEKRNRTHPRPARERGGVIVHRVGTLDAADRKHARSHVGRESPISNGLTTVAEHMVLMLVA